MMTLAELQALSAFVVPDKARALAPVLSLVPLYAIRSAKGMDAVYAMDAREAIDGMIDCLPHLLTVEMQRAAEQVVDHIKSSLSPTDLKLRLISRMAKAA